MRILGILRTGLFWVGATTALACDGSSWGSGSGSEGGAKDTGGEESTEASACIEGRVDVEPSSAWVPNRPVWVDAESFHVAHLRWDVGIIHDIVSRETGRVVRSQIYEVHSPPIDGLDAVGASPEGDMAFAFRYTTDGVIRQEVLSVSGGESKIWPAPWERPYYAWGLGWDGEGFTASLLNGGWATARFSAKGDLRAGVEVFAKSAPAKYGYFDTETDSQSGTTVFLGAGAPGVVLVGRRGRDSNLTSPANSWYFEGYNSSSPSGEVAVALNGPKALLAWGDGAEGRLMVREVSLETGESIAQWIVITESIFGEVAATWAADRWVIVGQNRKGLTLAEIRDNQIQQRTLLRHQPPCLRTDTCVDSTTRDWYVRRLAVIADGSTAWAGFVDMSTQRFNGIRTLLSYRIIPLRDGCNYKTLASE